MKGSALVVVCVPKAGVSGGSALGDQLAQAIAKGLGTPYRPSRVLMVSDLPRTRNMKFMRRVISAVCSSQEAGDLTSLLNPEVVTELPLRVSTGAGRA